MENFKVGNKVSTKEGSKYKGPFTGTIVGFSRWRNFRAANVRKSNGRIVQCLVHNLSVAKSSHTSASKSKKPVKKILASSKR